MLKQLNDKINLVIKDLKTQEHSNETKVYMRGQIAGLLQAKELLEQGDITGAWLDEMIRRLKEAEPQK